MAGYAVLKGAAYCLIQAPDLLLHSGATQTMEAKTTPGSEYLHQLPKHLRSYEQALQYPPNQVYIGNMQPAELAVQPRPWYQHPVGARRYGPFGEIMPETEFYGLLALWDSFDLVWLEPGFAEEAAGQLAQHSLLQPEQTEKITTKTMPLKDLQQLIEQEGALSLYYQDKLVGVVKNAHQTDENLSAAIMLENLAVKASGTLTLLHLLHNTGQAAGSIDYIIETSEAACGDNYQRGGGNFAKAIAEAAGLFNATGADIRGFCAGPAHGLLNAASLVQAGVCRNVVVLGGGCTAKLGMNGKEHLKKGGPVLEDCLAGFALLVAADDTVSPQIRTDLTGFYRVGAGASPQAVVEELVAKPLAKGGLRLTDIDCFAPELQNPEITQPAGAGDVPAANYKMIAAYGVLKGQLEKSQMAYFIRQRGLPGWAPTQGHIPSGIPYLGFAREFMLQKKQKRVMLIGKGSLFLGRMTNLFDGVSLLLEANQGIDPVIKDSTTHAAAGTVLNEHTWRVGIVPVDSEQPAREYQEAVRLATNQQCRPVLLPEATHQEINDMLANGQLDAAVTMHYTFPTGVASVGKVQTPGRGRPVYLACTTGVSDVNPACALIKNAIYGIIAAKAGGVENPSVGILNVAGAGQCLQALKQLQAAGYSIRLAESGRAEGGVLLRGNDLLIGTADVMVADSLTGNLLTKLLAAYNTGGHYEALGWGYGPGIGQDFAKLIMIVSRASGAPVVAGAIRYAVELLENGLFDIATAEFKLVEAAGLSGILQQISQKENVADTGIIAPPKEAVSAQVTGIDVLELDNVVNLLWQAGIYAESGMGCTGPVVLTAPANQQAAVALLQKAGYL